MSDSIVLLGSGKMARAIGSFLAAQGSSVVLASGNAARIPDLQRWAERVRRRAARGALSGVRPASAAVAYLGADALPRADMLIESGREFIEAKRAAIRAAQPCIDEGTLVCTNSSSILPQEVWPGCMGLHFFYPPELTGVVEVVVAQTSEISVRLLSQVDAWGLSAVVQTPTHAFAVNRMLLPVQNEAFRLLADGYPAPLVDALTTSDVLGVGLLSLIDSVGIDVVADSVRNYASRMAPEVRAEHSPLLDGLDAALARGLLGRRNGQGLLCGVPEAQRGRVPGDARREDLAAMFRALFLNTCAQFVQSGEIGARDLDIVAQGVFGASASLAQVARDSERSCGQALAAHYREAGISYFRPVELAALS